MTQHAGTFPTSTTMTRLCRTRDSDLGEPALHSRRPAASLAGVCAVPGARAASAPSPSWWHLPPSHEATASLVLAHDPQVDPSRAMATDVSLLKTRAVATKVDREPRADDAS